MFGGVQDAVGDFDGPIDNALFDHPKSLAIDHVGNVYVTTNNRIRLITLDGIVKTIAGPPVDITARGFKDGLGNNARFDDPTGIIVDKNGNLFIADRKNDRIRKITTEGRVVTFAGSGKQGKKDGPPTTATFDRPNGLDIDEEGNIYVADMHNGCIRMITPTGSVSTIAGSKDGCKNGAALGAQFFFPADVTIDPSTQDLIVADQYNHQIRRITNKDGQDRQVTTIAGMEECGFVDGTAVEAQFNSPSSIAVNANGEIYVSDTGNNAIRKINLNGTVETIAHKTKDIFSGKEIFHSPLGIILTKDGSSLIVADWQSNVLRKVNL